MDVLGIGYLGFESPNAQAWKTYGPEVLGMQLTSSPATDPDSVYLRMDDRRHRLAIHPGEIDQVSYIGWEVTNRSAYRDALTRFAAAGVSVEEGSREHAALRGVREVSRFKDPAGFQHEIFYAQEWQPHTFQSGRPGHRGFVCDDQGIGHCVLISPEPLAAVDDFFLNIMGFEWFGYGSGGMNMGFYRPKHNTRSHAIAYAHVPNARGMQHLAIGHKCLDDVGVAQDLVMAREMQLQMTLGRHTNDPVISFYHFTPSGFVVECLWEEHPWKEDNCGFEANPPKLSLWGHKVVGPMIGPSVHRVVKDDGQDPLKAFGTQVGPASMAKQN